MKRCFLFKYVGLVLNLFMIYQAQGQPLGAKLKAYRVDISLNSNSIQTLARDGVGYLWVGSQRGWGRYSAAGLEVYNQLRADIMDDYALAMHADSREDGGMWIGTEQGGLLFFDPELDGFRSFSLDSSGYSGPSSVYVQDLASTIDGSLWVATLGSGLFRYDSRSNALDTFRHSEPLLNTSLLSDSVTVLLASRSDSSSLWVGTTSGVSVFSMKGEMFEPIVSYEADDVIKPLGSVRILFESLNTIWCVTTDNEFLRFNKNRNVFEVTAFIPASMGEILVVEPSHEYPGIIWIGTRERGAFAYDLVSGKITPIQIDTRNSDGLRAEIVQAILEDDQGIVWIGTYNGLYKINLRAIHFGDTTRRISNGVMSLYQSRVATDPLWVGTYFKGLVRTQANGIIEQT